jgi:hypothetical protein
MTARMRSHEAYQQANVAAARIVAADAARFGGPEAALVRWARLVLDRAGPRSAPSDGGSFGGSQLDGRSQRTGGVNGQAATPAKARLTSEKAPHILR